MAMMACKTIRRRAKTPRPKKEMKKIGAMIVMTTTAATKMMTAI